MKRCNKRPFHGPGFTFVPARSHQPGKGRHDACLAPALLGRARALPLPGREQVSLNRADMSSLGQPAGHRRNRGLPAFSSCLGKTRAESGAAVCCPSAWDRCNSIRWEEEGSYKAPEVQERKRRAVCQERDRNCRLGLSAAGWASACSANLALGRRSLLSLTPLRARLLYPRHAPVATGLWSRILTQS